MAFNIIDTIKGYLTEEFSSTLAGKLGESESGTVKAIAAALPIILGSVFAADKTNSGILGKLKGLSGSSILDNLKGLVGSSDNEKNVNGVNTVVSSLLGNNQNKITQSISSYSGVTESSAKQILTVTSAAALGSLGHHATVNNLGESEFFSFLNSQKTNISAITPPNLNLAGLGLANLSVNTNYSTTDNNAVNIAAKNIAPPDKKSNTSKLIPLLLLLAGLVLAYFGYQSCNKSSTTGTILSDTIITGLNNEIANSKVINATTAKGTVDSLGNYVYQIGEMVTIELPNGAGVLKAGENSTEVKLIS